MSESTESNLAAPIGLYEEIRAAINRHSRENESNTPDFLLAEYLISVLAAGEALVTKRDRWHGPNVVPPSHGPVVS